jgi:hypothetical protein
METAVTDVTVNVAVPETAPRVAVIVAVPDATAFAYPAVGDVPLTVATVGSDEVHATVLVRFCVLLSL